MTLIRRRRWARTQGNSKYRRSNEYQSDRGNPVWLLFFCDGYGNRGRLQMGHEFWKSQQHRDRHSQRHTFQRKSERPYIGYDLLLSGLCQGPGYGRQELYCKHLLRQHPEVHNLKPKYLALELRDAGDNRRLLKCEQRSLCRTLLPRHLQ